MDHTTRVILPDLELAIGPHKSLKVRLSAPAQVLVEYTFEKGYPGLPTCPNGDPGEPGVPDEFDFKRIVAVRPLDLISRDKTLHLVVHEGRDLFDMFTPAALDDLQDTVLAAIRDENEQAHVDAAIAQRELAVLLGGRP